jgi:hypothetical protein
MSFQLFASRCYAENLYQWTQEILHRYATHRNVCSRYFLLTPDLRAILQVYMPYLPLGDNYLLTVLSLPTS